MTPELVSAARQESRDPVGSLPQNTQDAFWRARITGSTLVGHNPDQLPTKPINIDSPHQVLSSVVHARCDDIIRCR